MPHIHTHLQTSILDGIIRVSSLIQRLHELKMDSCAITDHGALFGALDFYIQCKEANIKPLLGMEAYCTTNKDGLSNEEKHKDNYHLVLIAMNNIGWKNLLWLSSNAYLNNFYYKPRVYMDNLIERSEGLIASTACIGNMIFQSGNYDQETKIFNDPDGRALRSLELLQTIFKDRLYAEIQHHEELPEQATYNYWLLEKAKQLNIKPIITTDAHFLLKEDYDTHQVILANQIKTTLEEYQKNTNLKYGPSYYVASHEELLTMANIYNCPEAYHNTFELAERCNVEIKLGKHEFPTFDITKCSDFQEYEAWKNTKKLL